MAALGRTASLVARGGTATGCGGKRLPWRLGSRAQVRALSLHEYQSQGIMKEMGIAVPKGEAVTTKEDALRVAQQLGTNDIVVKAQVLAGGRGLGSFANGFKSGVHVCFTPEDAANKAGKMLGQRLITKQTGAAGRPCAKVLITERLYMRREMYLAFLYDRESQGPVIVASSRGGTSIEDIARDDPDAIVKIPMSIETGMTEKIAQDTAEALGLEGAVGQAAAEQVKLLYTLFIEKDATMVEVNPLVETPDGKVVCVDAKINFDDNAAFRQQEIHALRDTTQEDPREVRAAKADLNYIGLDGNIGCLVNGAGLAMATMDIIKLHGGSPANFLDVGGSANEQQVTEAFTILNEDPKVEAILVNIFGGIMRCDVIAQGIINAASVLNMRVPLVVRLQGNKMKEAKQLIEQSGLRIIAADDLDLAASRACKLAEITHLANEADVDVFFK
ncbi:Succinate--CoA ligase ADP-forming subunit beta, mitochondrial [Porphyridium purpureum]|uniref:Succinate--CoA ligase [ADP-forming] subunit beta, mitochondrial n=1 Tax=Porphyridium purpureum TaxID=35688 RepID=A0A5J4Z651_PORPP|nr:Succinate--CoA ligase ADP-forming subunit beta, mitochondrial [Porphyridium purpureum]|eukprot:POR5850..scf295_1